MLVVVGRANVEEGSLGEDTVGRLYIFVSF